MSESADEVPAGQDSAGQDPAAEDPSAQNPAGQDSAAQDSEGRGSARRGPVQRRSLWAPHSRDKNPQPRMPTPRRWAVVTAAVGAGIGTGLLGTSLHGHAVFGTDYVIPLGAAAALLMLAAVELFVGLWSRSGWMAVLCGASAYACGGVLSLQLGAFGMISNNIQGIVWLYGIAVVTPLVAWWTWAILRRSK